MLQVGQAGELRRILVAHATELGVLRLVTHCTLSLFQIQGLRVRTIANSTFLRKGGRGRGRGRSGRRGRGGRGRRAAFRAAQGRRAMAGVQGEARVRVKLFLKLGGLHRVEALLNSQVHQADLIQHGFI
jgi:hypothetical protein